MSGELDKMNAGSAMMKQLIKFKEKDSLKEAELKAPKAEDPSVANKQEKPPSQKPDSFDTTDPNTKVIFAYQKPFVKKEDEIVPKKPPAPNSLANNDANAA